MILSFRDKQTAALFEGLRVRHIDIKVQRRALMKLQQLDAATVLEDMRVPPGNQLEALRGDRKGQHSVRVNQQWRLCFRWHAGNALDVEFCDYH